MKRTIIWPWLGLAVVTLSVYLLLWQQEAAAEWLIEKIAGIATEAENIPATQITLLKPNAVAVDAAGNIYLADTFNHRVRKIETSGLITTVAGTGESGYAGDGGPAASARLNGPYDIAVAGSGSIYIADTYNHCIRMIDTSGTITTVAGTGTAGYAGDGGPATAAQLEYPHGLILRRLKRHVYR